MPLQSWWWFTIYKVESEQQVKASQAEKVSDLDTVSLKIIPIFTLSR